MSALPGQLRIAATGHRPNRCGGYDTLVLARMKATARKTLKNLHSKFPDRSISVISGMALGWDTAIALAALDLELPLTCLIPFPGQPKYWPSKEVATWADIRARATRVITVCPEYNEKAMETRNEMLVENADIILALWDGKPGSGTAFTVQYAKYRQLPVINCWETFKKETL